MNKWEVALYIALIIVAVAVVVIKNVAYIKFVFI